MAKAKKTDFSSRRCMNCLNAYLMRSAPENPIVCECTITKERHVASTPHNEECGFKESDKEMEIHDMIWVR